MAAAPETHDVIQALDEERARLRGRHERGLGGLVLARALAESMDRSLAELWGRIVGDERKVALVALGGYGRGELSPRSDVDLMVLHGGNRRADELARPLFYALWDAGLKVGHATRAVKQCLRLAAENLEAETSFLTTRLVAGDKRVYDEFAERTVAATRKRIGGFVADVREMMRARHAVGGTATSTLEPNLKEGTGGLRDLHVLEWFRRVTDEVDAIIGERDAGDLAHAAELLTRVRNHLHYLTEAATDTLSFAHQRPTALLFGYDDSGRPAEDEFMRDLFHATRHVEHAVNTVVAELAARTTRGRSRVERDECFSVESGRVVLTAMPDLRAEPHRALDLFAQGVPPGGPALRWLEQELDRAGELPWTDEVRRAFFRLLRAGDPAALEAADVSGVIGALLPAWGDVRCQPQHNVYHRFTVDAHLFNTVAQAAALGSSDEEPLAREVLSDVADPDGVLLASLLHDIGKGTEEDHAVRGERMALEICERMGIGEPRRGNVAWLARHHLMLIEAAMRRDLNDENLIVDVAGRIGDPERAKMLYLVTVADGRATGPTAWNPWRAALVAELFTKVMHVMERGELASRDAVELARLRMAELREGLERYPPADVERHIDGMPRAYILAYPATTMVRHYALMAEPLADGSVRTHVAPDTEQDVYELTLVARDRPGLFSKISGVLAINGVNILAAQGFTRADGIAVEVFRCVGAFERTIDDPRWGRIAEESERALRGRLSLPVRLEQKRRDYGARAPLMKRRHPKVIVDNAASDFLTVVEVHAPDRIGLLYEITAAFEDLSLDIQSAKVATYGQDVVDVFYVRDLEGQKITDPGHLGEIEHTLLLRLGASDGS